MGGLSPNLGEELVRALAEGFPIREYTTGTIFFSPEEPRERLFLLQDGRVDLYRITRDGKRLVTRRIAPGGIFGEVGLLGKSMRGCFAEAMEDCRVCVASRGDFLRILRTEPDIALRLLEEIGNRLKALEERLERTAYSSVVERLAAFVLENAEPASQVLKGLSHAEIAETIGASRVTTTLTLGELERCGLIEVGYKLISVRSRSGLAQIASFGDGSRNFAQGKGEEGVPRREAP